jgi:hypothetical protein
MMVEIDAETRKEILSHGDVPLNFSRWDDCGRSDLPVAHVCAKRGLLPANFTLWELTTKLSGQTVAHVAAQWGHLPKDFDRWELADKSGWTVGHEVATMNYIPADFDQWALTNDEGWSVAHEAVYRGILPVFGPANFDQWGLADNVGSTVLYRFLLTTQANRCVARWAKERPLCRTEADWAVFKTELPEIYSKHIIEECMPNVDNEQKASQEASQEASQGALL